MSKVEEMYKSLSEEEIALYSADAETEPHIVINDDRFIVVPEVLRRLGVKGDKNIETVTWDCPRYWDEHDMSKMVIYIIYEREDKYTGKYKAYNVKIDETDDRLMHFDWTVSENVTEVHGKLKVQVCVKDVDSNGKESEHWSSEISEEFYISDGLNCDNDETVTESYPDLVTEMMKKLNEFEDADYWKWFLNEDFSDYGQLDVMAMSIASPKAIHRIKLAEGSVLKSVLGDGDFVAIKSTSDERLLIVNIINGETWTYVKGSYELNKVESGGSTEGKYWKNKTISPVRDYEQLDFIIEDEDALDTLYQIEIAGLSTLGSVIGSGSYIGIVCDYNNLTLCNKHGFEVWTYVKGSYELNKVESGGSAVVDNSVIYIPDGTFETIDDFYEYPFEVGKLHQFFIKNRAQVGHISTVINYGFYIGYCHYMENEDAYYMELFNTTYPASYFVNLTHKYLHDIYTRPDMNKYMYKSNHIVDIKLEDGDSGDAILKSYADNRNLTCIGFVSGGTVNPFIFRNYYTNNNGPMVYDSDSSSYVNADFIQMQELSNGDVYRRLSWYSPETFIRYWTEWELYKTGLERTATKDYVDNLFNSIVNGNEVAY